MTRSLVAAVLLVSTLLSGCGPDEEEAPTVTTATTLAAPPLSGDAGAESGPGDDTGGAPPSGSPFATTSVSVPPAPYAYLTAVRAARQAGFDRVVFEFESSLPGYRVGYVERPVVEDGSGEQVKVEGEALLEVHMEAASGADLSRGSLRQTYTGPRRVDPDTDVVTEVVRVSDFEANLDWVIGLRRGAPFRVFTLTGPPRLVVDVSSASG